MLIELLYTILTPFVFNVHAKDDFKYCVIGAGPAGLQIAHDLQNSENDYVIIERNSHVGSFFEKYPRHGTLISVNRKYTGSTNTEFNSRHDWNSLLGDFRKFGTYSGEFYPRRKDLVEYFRDFQRYFRFNMRFNTSVETVSPLFPNATNPAKFLVNYKSTSSNSTGHIRCQVLIVATGLAKPKSLNLKKAQKNFDKISKFYYHEMPMDPKFYRGKRILIIGKGNSALESARALQSEAAVLHLTSRSTPRFAWSTHYVGDIRAINNEILDNYQLKTVDGLLDVAVEDLKLFADPDGSFHLKEKKNPNHKYDHMLLCTGWLFDTLPFVKVGLSYLVQSRKTEDDEILTEWKYPMIDTDFSSTGNSDLYIAGAAAHGLDYKKSAGGFIHGFRYTARTLVHILQNKYEKRKWPSKSGEQLSEVANHLLRRMNEAGSLYQMFGVLADVVIVTRSQRLRRTYVYLEDIPLRHLPELQILTGHVTENRDVIVMNMQYGRNFSGPVRDVFFRSRVTTRVEFAHMCHFLHPVVNFYKTLPDYSAMQKAIKHGHHTARPDALLHLLENFLTEFRSPSHVHPLINFLSSNLHQDLHHFHSVHTERFLSLLTTGYEAAQRGIDFTIGKKKTMRKLQFNTGIVDFDNDIVQ